MVLRVCSGIWCVRVRDYVIGYNVATTTRVGKTVLYYKLGNGSYFKKRILNATGVHLFFFFFNSPVFVQKGDQRNIMFVREIFIP